MKAIIDTNIILDAIASRTPFDVSAKEIIFMVAAKKFEAAITASTASDIYYITRKYLQSEIKTIQEMKKLFSLVDIVNVEKSDCLAAFDMGMDDYEDSLLAVCAFRWKADYIITRNLSDFANSPVPAISPKDFIERFN